jgi:hypothetical protein
MGGIMKDGNGVSITTANPLPINIQSRYSQTIQTHNAVSIGASQWSTSTTWIDCDGFDKIAFTLLNDAIVTSSGNILWSNDGVAQHGEEVSVLATNNLIRKTGITDVKARYAKLSINNGDASAHTISAWAYLKA